MTTIDPFAALNAAQSTNGVAAVSAAASAKAKADEAGSAERFIKLLVTQMQNQDPLNPMDNAQITSQMAQINTVNGIERLNETVAGLNRQFVQMQALQGAALVGHEVTLQGDRLTLVDGVAEGGFELAGSADRVKVDVLSPAGRVVDTLDLGAQGEGRHDFVWRAAPGMTDGLGYRFRVAANAGSRGVNATPLMRDQVEAVSLRGDTLQLDTRLSGRIDYAAIKSFN